MEARTVVDVEGWDSRPFEGGYDGLGDLAAREFTGCVVAGDTYLFMTRGRVVGVFDYVEPSVGDPSLEPVDVDRFEGADGTAYEAPHDAPPLLFAMVARGGEVRGRYYSNDTPLEEVDRTLRDGGFTGYLELSENVLSGDYYLVYHGGRRRTVAFVGQSRRLKTDEEAFDLAADEVGIYEVNAVPLSTVEIPGSSAAGDGTVVPDTGPPSAGGGEDDATAGSGDSDATGGGEPSGADRSPTATGVESSSDSPETGSGTAETGGGSSPDRPEIDLDAAMNPGGTDERTGDEGRDEDAADPSPASPFGGAGTDQGGEADTVGDVREVESPGGNAPEEASTDDPGRPGPPGAAGVGPADPDDPEELDPGEVGEALAAGPESSADSEAEDEPGRGDETESADETGSDDGTPDETGDGPETDSDTGTTAAESSISAVPEDETVGPGEGPPEPPSLGVSEPAGEATPEDVEAAAAAAETELETGSGAGSAEESESEPDAGPDHGTGSAAAGADGVDAARVVPSIDPDRTARAEPSEEDGTADRQMIDGETVAGLRSELSAREARIEELRERLESVEAARDELEAERDRLEERVSELERRLEESGAAPIRNTREVPPSEALSETNVLVRYRSKGEPTLADAHDGEAEREALAENIVLEPHPSFDTEDVSVSGRTYDAFLESTRAYGFLRWLVGEFVYEIRDTGNTDALEPLYDALPALDRVEFDATVTLEGTDRETARFDLVGRDRRGNPLLVALLEDDRAPTNATTMREFVRAATAAAESHGSLAGAFAVTASYFEPEALEMVEEATTGSLLSRSKRKSFVSTSRKGGYHLCLVEDREDSFYLSEPEL